MKKYISFLALFVSVVFFSHCKKENTPNVTGFYVGSTQRTTTISAGSNITTSDTIFTQTIEVRNLNADSIAIGDNHFLANDVHQYFLQQGTQYAYSARFNTEEDSLVIQIYEYNTQADGFLQSDTEFKGKKQQ